MRIGFSDRAAISCGNNSSCHLVRSHSVFAIVADGFDWTSFHGFLAKRLLLRGGRLLKYIGVAAVVAAREISGCGFPAQVAVNALVIAVKLTGHVFRVFIRNVGHRFSFVLCRWNSIRAFRDTVAEYLLTANVRHEELHRAIRHLLGMLAARPNSNASRFSGEPIVGVCSLRFAVRLPKSVL
jgi:hypothetical protein